MGDTTIVGSEPIVSCTPEMLRLLKKHKAENPLPSNRGKLPIRVLAQGELAVRQYVEKMVEGQRSKAKRRRASERAARRRDRCVTLTPRQAAITISRWNERERVRVASLHSRAVSRV